MYKPIVSVLEKGIKESGTNQIIDLGSGDVGGLIWLNEELKKNNSQLKILLTDYYPNISTFEYYKTSVDARNVPKELIGLRTQFLSLHHFKPKDAIKILQNTVDANSSIAIFEAQERSISSILAMIFSPLTVLFITPFIKPFKLGRIIFTYIIPIVPLFVLWDGIVSSLRIYSVEEMRELIKNIENSKNFNWNIESIKSGPGVILYLLGIKKK
jgi:hypothetical protein